jgi:hypothetical protein
MAKTGSINDRIFFSATIIDIGKKLRDVTNLEAIGHITFNRGLSLAAVAFKDADNTREPRVIWNAEMLLLTQQKAFHSPQDKIVLHNLDLLIERAADALRCLDTISYYSKYINHPTDNDKGSLLRAFTRGHPECEQKALFKVHPAYIDAERTYPASNRTSDNLPKDAFHNACDYVYKAYKNHLADPLKGELEKAFYKQRSECIKTAKSVYIEMQRDRMGLPPAASKSKKRDKGSYE